VRWAERGVWEDIFAGPAGAEDTSDRVFIDSTCIKVQRCAGSRVKDQAFDRGSKASGTGVLRTVSALPKQTATQSYTPSATRNVARSS